MNSCKHSVSSFCEFRSLYTVAKVVYCYSCCQLLICTLVDRMMMVCRGFTTLSSTLGHLVIALHDGLLHAISNESQVPALMNMLKALGTLMMSAAYTRLPSDLLIRCIEVNLCALFLDMSCLMPSQLEGQAASTAAVLIFLVQNDTVC